MTLIELYEKLKRAGIPESKFYLHGLYGSLDDSDKIALQIKKEKNRLEYETYFKERGRKYSIKIFITEDEACQYLYRQLLEERDIEARYSNS